MLFSLFYKFVLLILTPLNYVLAIFCKLKPLKYDVLHISYMVHIPYYTVELLKKEGLQAHYLAKYKAGPTWNKSDYHIIPSHNPIIRAFQEFYWFWSIASQYKIIHMHFMQSIGTNGWDYKWLQRLGIKIVVHYRGCEIRDKERNMHLHPQINICQQCDYNATLCTNKNILQLREIAKKYANLELVTTPDMKDFVPDAIHFPFFAPKLDKSFCVTGLSSDKFRMVHVTNHPGIEGVEQIQQIVNELNQEGYEIEYIVKSGLSHDDVLRLICTADLTIGKMKMGYYANAQIESLALGIPAITWVREEFLTQEIENSGLIISSLDTLKATIKRYVNDQELMGKKRASTIPFVQTMHNNDKLIQELISLYKELQ